MDGLIDFSKINEAYRDELAESNSLQEKDPEKVEQAFKAQEEIVEIVKETGRKICELGKRLIPFRDNRMYVYLGYDSFQEWYQDVGLSKTTVYRAINIYEIFVMQFGLPEDEVYSKDIRKLDKLLPLRNELPADAEPGKIVEPILNPHNAEEWLQKCELSESDLIREINEAKGKKSLTDKLEDEHMLQKGTYVLVKTSEDVSQMQILSEKKLPVEIYKNDEGDFVIRIL